MSADISIYAVRADAKADVTSFEDVSRYFCSLVRCLDEKACELKQISKITGVDISVIEKMSTWPLWQQMQSGRIKTKLGKKRIVNKYNNACEKSWQDVDKVLTCFTRLHSGLMKDLYFERKISYFIEGLSGDAYFRNFDKNVTFGDHRKHANFGWDLRNIIAFLEQAKAKGLTHVRFHVN